eukprot:Pgem_evm1s18079
MILKEINDGNPDKALSMIRKLKNEGFEPNIETYTFLIKGFDNKKFVEHRLEKIESIFQMATEDKLRK